MKSLLFVAVVLLNAQVFAQIEMPKPLWEAKPFPEMISCVTAPRATYSVVVKNLGDKVTVQYHNQVDSVYTPLFTGSVNALKFEELAQAFDIAQKLGKGFTATFDRKQCAYFGYGMMDCHDYQSEPLLVGNHKVQVLSVWSMLTMQASWSGTHKEATYFMSLVVDGKQFFLPLTYDEEFCAEIESKETEVPIVIPRDPQTEAET